MSWHDTSSRSLAPVIAEGLAALEVPTGMIVPTAAV
jgi:hypothetical protein